MSDDLAAQIAAEVARQLERAVTRTVIATVSAVNPDGTVNVSLRGATVPGLPALTGYTNRTAGDAVVVLVRPGEMVVLGREGSGVVVGPPQVTVSDAAASGGDWQEIQAWWAIPGSPTQLWAQRATPYVPPTPTAGAPASLTAAAAASGTYRGGVRVQIGAGMQGDPDGTGARTGVWVFAAGAWAALSGKTVVGCRVTLQRSGTQWLTWGPVPVTFWTHDAGATLPEATPALLWWDTPGALQANQQATFTLPVSFGEALRDGTADGLAIFTSAAADVLDTQGSFIVTVDYY